MTKERTNEQWIRELSSLDPTEQDAALNDLRDYLQRGIYYYLSRERSDLASVATNDLMQMAEDFSQDATLRILDNLASFRGDSRFTTWAMKIGTRTAISELRRARYKDFSLDAITADGEFMAAVDQNENSNHRPPNPEKVTERQDVLRIIREALEDALTERQRTAL